jgi:tocopherol O-methyltransferase
VVRSSRRLARVAAHYDELSDHYVELWGEHIHHGYYERGDESREEATRKLLALLVAELPLRPGARVVDVGCGVGGAARLLARMHGCSVTGVTLSGVQARMAASASTMAGDPCYVVADAQALPLAPSFDAMLAVEVLSHLESRSAFFAEAARLLRPSGRIGIAAWIRAEGLTDDQEEALIRPIEDGMLVTLPDRAEYQRLLAASGLTLASYRDVSRQVARTWDLCVEIVRQPALWSLALRKGSDTLAFVKSFRSMQKGFATGALRYALIVAERR